MDRGAWWDIVYGVAHYGVAKSWTLLNDLSVHIHTHDQNNMKQNLVLIYFISVLFSIIFYFSSKF